MELPSPANVSRVELSALLRDGRRLFFDFATFLEKFVEQHHIYRVISDGVDFALFIANDSDRTRAGVQ